MTSGRRNSVLTLITLKLLQCSTKIFESFGYVAVGFSNPPDPILIRNSLDKLEKIVNNINTGRQFTGLPDALRGLTVLIYFDESRFLIQIKS